MKMRLSLMSAMTGLALTLASSGPVLAQEESATDAVLDPSGRQVMIANGDDASFQGQTAGMAGSLTVNDLVETGASSFSTDAAGAFAGPAPGNGVSGIGHASDSSNNTMGDIAEGLSNQNITRDH